jgi:hypothetical protein
MIETTLPSLPIIPLTTPSSLATALHSFITSAFATQTTPQWPLDITQDLLPHCTANNPLSLHTTTTLSSSILSLRTLLDEITTLQGRSQLGDAIAESEATGLVAFWTHELEIE